MSFPKIGHEQCGPLLPKRRYGLSGDIPGSLTSLKQLTQLAVGDNALTCKMFVNHVASCSHRQPNSTRGNRYIIPPKRQAFPVITCVDTVCTGEYHIHCWQVSWLICSRDEISKIDKRFTFETTWWAYFLTRVHQVSGRMTCSR